MGLFATIAERSSAAIHFLHRLEEQRDGCVQNRRPGRVSQIVGHSEKPLVDELRQNVTGSQILLQS